MPRTELDQVKALRLARGFVVIRDWLPTSLALRDSTGREVDLHPVDAPADGGGYQVLGDGTTWHYAPPAHGSLGSRRVRCASAEDQLLMHQGYDPCRVAYSDVRRVSKRFGLEPPAPFGAPDEGSA